MREDLLGRSKGGIWAHLVCMLLLLATTNLYARAPVLANAFAISIGMLTLARILLLRSMVRSTEAMNRWHRVHIGLMLACAAVWGLVDGFGLWRFGYEDHMVVVGLLYHAAITFGTVNLFVHDRRLMAVSLTLLFAPLALGDLLHAGSSPLPYLGAGTAYMLYCHLQGKKLHQQYEQQISDRYELAIAAYQDSLTGLPNRLYLNELLDSCFEAAKIQPQAVALLYIDLDGFKKINDCYSHRIGDLFLHEAAQRMRGALRAQDVAARIGGDEFVILLPHCESEEKALQLADRVLADTHNPVYLEGLTLTYSASIGVSVFPLSASNQHNLIRSADEAMYLAKRSGKSRVCVAPLQTVSCA